MTKFHVFTKFEIVDDDLRHWSWSIGEWLQNKSGASTTATCPTGAPSLVCPLFIFLLLPSIFNSSDDARKRERVSSQGIFNYRFFFVPPLCLSIEDQDKSGRLLIDDDFDV